MPKNPKKAYEKAIEVAKVIYFEVDKLSLKEKKGKIIKKVSITLIIMFIKNQF